MSIALKIREVISFVHFVRQVFDELFQLSLVAFEPSFLKYSPQLERST